MRLWRKPGKAPDETPYMIQVQLRHLHTFQLYWDDIRIARGLTDAEARTQKLQDDNPTQNFRYVERTKND